MADTQAGYAEDARCQCRDRCLGRAVPYGVYDIASNAGWVSVGIDHDTASFAVNAIRRWWHSMGRARYPQARRSWLITADCGGSNGARSTPMETRTAGVGQRTWPGHHRLPSAARHQQMEPIEHRLFSSSSAQNWRGKPLVSYQTIVQLIGATTTRTGLQGTVRHRRCSISGLYEGVDAEMADLKLTPHEFHGEWNYTIGPRSRHPNRSGYRSTGL